jgi:hypothetical protein
VFNENPRCKYFHCTTGTNRLAPHASPHTPRPTRLTPHAITTHALAPRLEQTKPPHLIAIVYGCYLYIHEGDDHSSDFFVDLEDNRPLPEPGLQPHHEGFAARPKVVHAVHQDSRREQLRKLSGR